ncbi:MAG: AAA family ATPase [Actinobacteria bacterium]|nr:AAA family ATPase [Actinomycetota bacterium]
MPVKWVTAPPAEALQLLIAGVRDRGGAVLVGPAGAGKTQLADAVRAHLDGRSDRVAGTVSQRAVPFSAFEALIDIPDGARTAAILDRARDRLGDGRLLIVDDASLLDPLSASLVYQLAVCGATRMIVVVDADGSAPQAISSIWRDEVLPRIDVGARTRFDAHVVDVLAGVPGEALTALQFLAVEDPLPAADLAALAGPDALGIAEAHDVVVNRDGVAGSAHPRYTDAVRERTGAATLRRLRTALVDRLAAHPPDGIVARLRLAVLALDSDSPRPAPEVIAAGEDALRLGDLELGERLGRAAVTHGGGFPARLLLAHALAWQGRGREADAVLAEVDSAELTEDELMAWALPRAANQFWMLSEPERATAFLHTTRNRVSSPEARVTLDALAATLAMNAGNPSRAMEIAESVLDSPEADATAVGWSAATAALSCARMGRFGEVDTLAERAMAAGHPGLLRFTSGFGQTTALLMTGRVEDAQTLARRLADFAQTRQPGRAIGQILLADVLTERGQFADAVALLREAAGVLAPTGYSWGPLASMLLARTLGMQGALVEAAKVLSRAESRHGLKSMLFAPELAQARAWTLAARRDTHGAVAAARDAARAAERGGQRSVAVRALHDAVRLGDGRAADGIARLGVDCEFAELAIDHGRALAAGDAAGLRAVSARFADAGLAAAAAAAASQAS